MVVDHDAGVADLAVFGAEGSDYLSGERGTSQSKQIF